MFPDYEYLVNDHAGKPPASLNGAVMTRRCPFQFTSFIRFPEPVLTRFSQPRELQVIPKNGFNSKGSVKAGFSLAKIVGFTICLF